MGIIVNACPAEVSRDTFIDNDLGTKHGIFSIMINSLKVRLKDTINSASTRDRIRPQLLGMPKDGKCVPNYCSMIYLCT